LNLGDGLRAREGCAIPRRIAFLNEKGGSAKTTLAANLGAYLALRRGHRVLAIDMDPQGQLGRVLGVKPRSRERSALDLLLDTVLDDDPVEAELAGAEPRAGALPAKLPLVASRVAKLDLILSNKALGLAPAFGGDDPDPTGRLERRLEGAPELGRYDFVLLDSPPSFGPLTLNVLRAAHEIVIPVPLTFLALDGCAQLMQTIQTVRTRYHHTRLRITMVVPTFYRRTRLANDILEQLKSHFPKEIAQTVVGYHVKIDEAQSHGLSVFEYAPRDRGARALAALAEELEARRPAPEGAPA
jgi:chromosome partitioning protein